jgi:hypothetical protein
MNIINLEPQSQKILINFESASKENDDDYNNKNETIVRDHRNYMHYKCIQVDPEDFHHDYRIVTLNSLLVSMS